METQPRTRDERNQNGYRGIVKYTSRHTGRVTYIARLFCKGKQYRSRRFDNIEDAVKAYAIIEEGIR